jgi:hypothetical protein
MEEAAAKLELQSVEKTEAILLCPIQATNATTALFSPEDIQRFVNLGLGRGVDLTNPHPWANKSSFQVRSPSATGHIDTLIGTNEGGMLQKFESHILSKKSIQMQLKASVSIPHTPVSLGVEGELARGTRTSKKVNGQRVTNTEISFRIGTVMEAEHERAHITTRPPDFEEILSRFLWKLICRRSKDRTPEEVFEKSATSLLTEYLQSSSKEENALIAEDCGLFVSYFGVTHYVSSITLGASEHTVVTKSSRTMTATQGFNISVPFMARTEEKISIHNAFSKSLLNTHNLGKIVDGKVRKGSEDEAVTKMKILPIYSLIRCNLFLFVALHKAIADYADEGTASLKSGMVSDMLSAVHFPGTCERKSDENPCMCQFSIQTPPMVHTCLDFRCFVATSSLKNAVLAMGPNLHD